jgi:hypothetical protein
MLLIDLSPVFALAGEEGLATLALACAIAWLVADTLLGLYKVVKGTHPSQS